MAAAIKTILLADLVMSLDNVIAVAAAAKGNIALLIIGLAISIPLVIFASRLLLVLMERFPIIITLGAALLGWVAGDMAVTDPVVKPWVDLHAPFLHWAAPLAGAIAVIAVGKWLAAAHRSPGAPPRRRRSRPVPASVTDDFRRLLLAADGSPPARARGDGASSPCASSCATATSRSTWSTSSGRCPATSRASSAARRSRNTTASAAIRR